MGSEAPKGFLIKAWRVAVNDFTPYLYYEASRGKALRSAWWGYCNYRHVSFKDFLRIARCWREWPMDDDFGAAITVCGKPAFYITRNTQYVQFVRPFELEYGNAHPLEVEPERMRPPAYRAHPPPETPHAGRK